jgi:hypothetical protein
MTSTETQPATRTPMSSRPMTALLTLMLATVATLAASALAPTAAQAGSGIYSNISADYANERACSATTCQILASHPRNTTLHFVCAVRGQMIHRSDNNSYSNVWVRTDGGGFINNNYLSTPGGSSDPFPPGLGDCSTYNPSSSTPARAGNIPAPFTAGTPIYVWQGYNSGTHTGTSAYGVDLTLTNNSASTSGQAVVAPISGTISHWQASYGNLCINFGSASYTLTHIRANRTSGTVRAGDTLGSVLPAGQAGNNGIAHLHFEVWSRPNCYNNSPTPLDVAHGVRIIGAPDMTANGPSATNNGTWSGSRFTA